MRQLRVLFASGNPFTELPEVLGRCERLDLVGFKSCRIERVTAAALPARLRWLILTDNRIEQLPPGIGRCGRLQKLALAGNRLRELPPELAACTALELLRISANRLEALPDWLLTLPRLCWLAFGGNPFNAAQEAAALAETPIDAIAWSELEPGRLLGQGASGWVEQALWRGRGNDDRPIALKRFKGEITSDGLPRSEIAAWLRAGAHPALVPVLGRIEGHPDAAQVMAMPLIGPEFSRLADPPSLESCTRAGCCMATSTVTTSCTTARARSGSGISAPRACCRPTTGWPNACKGWRRAPSVACSKNCWSAALTRLQIPG